MIVMNKAISRRAILRGVGASFALPLLDAMVPALSAASAAAVVKPVRRLGFMYIPNGAILGKWTPESVGTGFEFTPTLKPLEPFRDRLVVVSNLASRPAEAEVGEGSGDHARASAVWLSGIHPNRTEGADLRGGTTIDQIAAEQLGRDTQLRSLELAVEDFSTAGSCDIGYSCAYVNTLSWRTPTTPLPMQTNPRTVFEQLFGDDGSADARQRRLEEDRSILDAIVGEIGRLQKRLGAGDRRRVTDYLDGVREIERRIKKIEEQAESQLALPDLPAGIPDLYDDHVKLMYDLQVLAYQADITRVTTFMLSREASQRTYSHIGVPDAHHSISHHGNVAEKMERVAKINAYHVSLFGYFLDKLRSTPDGEGNLLDHSLLLYGGCISDPNLHSHSPLPVLLAGGAAGQLKGGRHIRYAPDTPMTNLLTSMLEKVNVETGRIGDATGTLSDL
jgi:hypothetical protein